jgi:hypothetical protein
MQQKLISKPTPDTHEKCPLWRERMSKVCPTCHWYTEFSGKEPTSTETFHYWACSVPMFSKLMIEVAQMERQTGAAVESFRNVMGTTQLKLMDGIRALAQLIDERIPSQPRDPKLINGAHNATDNH